MRIFHNGVGTVNRDRILKNSFFLEMIKISPLTRNFFIREKTYSKVFSSEKSKKKFFRDCNLSGIKLYVSVAILWKKMNRNHEVLKILTVPNFYPYTIWKVTLDLSIKCLILLGKYDPSILCPYSTL